MTDKNECPCCSSSSFESCCAPFINGTQSPQTAEQLMRSRYTAFVMEDEGYLFDSWHPDFRPSSIDFDAKTKWLGLKIKTKHQGKQSDNEGYVNFVARYKIDGKAHRIEENSLFNKINNKWVYVKAV